MSKTIKELAEELSLSKSGIRKYLTASFRVRYTHEIAHRILIDDAGIKVIKEMIAYKGVHSERTQKVHGVHTEQASAQSNSVLVEQLRAKDKQIEHLQKLLDQSQQLQLMAENKLKRLEMPQNGPERSSEPGDDQIHDRAPEAPQATKNSPEQPVPFWQRLFSPRK